MIGYAPAIGYGATIKYSTSTIPVTTMNDNMVMYDYGTGAATTSSSYLCVKYQRVTDNATQEWAQWGEMNGAQGYGPIAPLITTGMSTASTTVQFYNWGEVAVEETYRMWQVQWQGTYGTAIYPPKPKTPAEQLKAVIAHRCGPRFIGNMKSLNRPSDIREQRARETLCRVIGEEKYRRFIVQGHVTARAKSGLVYQIFPGHGITNVYNKGEKVERLCVVLKGDFPPTDSLIVRYLMILNNEENFRSYANKHQVIANLWPKEIEDMAKEAAKRPPKSLAEIYSDIKSGKHARLGEVAPYAAAA